MQEYEYKGSESPVEVKIVYRSEFYTVARASVEVGKNGRHRTVYAEGESRRAWIDFENNPTRGDDVAVGRAKKALARKLSGMYIRRIQKATDLLMSC